MGLCGRGCPRYGPVAMAQDQELLLAIDRELPGAARSELSRTLRRNFHALRERIGERPDWAALARIFAEHGVVDRNGKPPSRHALRKAWARWCEPSSKRRSASDAAPKPRPRIAGAIRLPSPKPSCPAPATTSRSPPPARKADPWRKPQSPPQCCSSSSPVIRPRTPPSCPWRPSTRKPETAPALFPPVQAIDLTGKPKAWFVIGRGGVGKTTLLRWAAERADQNEARMVVAAADPLNRSLRLYRDNVVEPPSNDPAATADWTQALLLRCMELGASALIDLGGGDTSLHRLLQTVPDLAAVLHDGGLEAVAVHIVGANPHDLVPLAETEAAGFQPAATALVCNERLDPRDKFGR